VLAGGSVECWGWDRDGQIGDGDDGEADGCALESASARVR
jgi:hypothetical protein